MAFVATDLRVLLGHWLQKGQPTRTMFFTRISNLELQSGVEYTAIEFNKAIEDDLSGAHGSAICLRTDRTSTDFDQMVLVFHHTNVNSAELRIKILRKCAPSVWRSSSFDLLVVADVSPKHCLHANWALRIDAPNRGGTVVATMSWYQFGQEKYTVDLRVNQRLVYLDRSGVWSTQNGWWKIWVVNNQTVFMLVCFGDFNIPLIPQCSNEGIKHSVLMSSFVPIVDGKARSFRSVRADAIPNLKEELRDLDGRVLSLLRDWEVFCYLDWQIDDLLTHPWSNSVDAVV